MNTEDKLLLMAIIASIASRKDSEKVNLSCDLGNFTFYGERVYKILDESLYFTHVKDKIFNITSEGKKAFQAIRDARRVWIRSFDLISDVNLTPEFAFSDSMKDLCNEHVALSDELKAEIFGHIGLQYDYRKAMLSFFAYSYAKNKGLLPDSIDFVSIYFLSFLDQEALDNPDFWGRLFAGMIYRDLSDQINLIKDWNETCVDRVDGEEVNDSWQYMSILSHFFDAENKRRGIPGLLNEDYFEVISISNI